MNEEEETSGLKIMIPIPPRSVQGGFRFGNFNGRNVRYSDTSKKTYQAFIINWCKHFAKEDPIEGPVRIAYTLFFQRPKYMLGKKYYDGPLLHTTKPDGDDTAKGIQDCLHSGRVFKDGKNYQYGAGIIKDDSQVAVTIIKKYYTAKGQEPCIIIKIAKLKEKSLLL